MGSTQLPLKLLLQKLELETLRREVLSVLLTFPWRLASAQDSNVWSPKHAEGSQSCPSQAQLGNTKEKGCKVMPSLGSQTQETVSQDDSTQTMRKLSLSPSPQEEQNQNWRSLC